MHFNQTKLQAAALTLNIYWVFSARAAYGAHFCCFVLTWAKLKRKDSATDEAVILLACTGTVSSPKLLKHSVEGSQNTSIFNPWLVKLDLLCNILLQYFRLHAQRTFFVKVLEITGSRMKKLPVKGLGELCFSPIVIFPRIHPHFTTTLLLCNNQHKHWSCLYLNPRM